MASSALISLASSVEILPREEISAAVEGWSNDEVAYWPRGTAAARMGRAKVRNVEARMLGECVMGDEGEYSTVDRNDKGWG